MTVAIETLPKSRQPTGVDGRRGNRPAILMIGISNALGPAVRRRISRPMLSTDQQRLSELRERSELKKLLSWQYLLLTECCDQRWRIARMNIVIDRYSL
jgi:hypothetical protein